MERKAQYYDLLKDYFISCLELFYRKFLTYYFKMNLNLIGIKYFCNRKISLGENNAIKLIFFIHKTS